MVDYRDPVSQQGENLYPHNKGNNRFNGQWVVVAQLINLTLLDCEGSNV